MLGISSPNLCVCVIFCKYRLGSNTFLLFILFVLPEHSLGRDIVHGKFSVRHAVSFMDSKAYSGNC